MLFKLLGWLKYAIKRAGFAPVARKILAAAVPGTSGWGYRVRSVLERATYANVDAETLHALPPIQGYWSTTYLRPMLQRFGFSDVESFFEQYLLRAYRSSSRATRRFVSVGAGNCQLEIELARRLYTSGATDFVIECMEMNDAMLERGRASAAEQGVAAHIRELKADFNRWNPDGHYDAVIANQALHHVVNLEGLFAAIARAISPDGVFLASDMIGRNGHQRWPEARAILDTFWRELPDRYKYNHMQRHNEHTYQDVDYSSGSFEGIRAQDILPLAMEMFDYDLFIGFANVIDPFVDRTFGPNFDVNDAGDRALIDRIHARDNEAIRDGSIKPTHMIAAFCSGRAGERRCIDHLTPEFCVRRT